MGVFYARTNAGSSIAVSTDRTGRYVGGLALAALAGAAVTLPLAAAAFSLRYGRKLSRAAARAALMEDDGADLRELNDEALQALLLDIDPGRRTWFTTRWVAEAKAKFPRLTPTTANLLMVSSWLDREMQVDSPEDPERQVRSVFVRASTIPRIAMLALMPSRAELAANRLLKSRQFQQALDAATELTQPARNLSWSLAGWAEWWNPPTLLKEK